MWEKIKGLSQRYYIGNDWVASKKELADILGVSTRQIDRYVKQGLDKHEASISGYHIYDVEKAKKYQTRNVKSEKSNKKNISADDEVILNELENLEDEIFEKRINELIAKNRLPAVEAERLEKNVKAKKAMRDLSILEDKFISVQDTKNTLIELLSTLSASLKKLSKDIPRDCYGLKREEFKEELERIFKNEIEALKKILKGTLNNTQQAKATDERLIDIINIIFNMLDEGKSITYIIEKLEE